MLFLWSQNVAEADPADVVVPLLVTTGVAAILTVLLGLLFRDVRRAAVLLTPIVVGLLMYGHAARVGPSLHVPVLLQQVAWLTLIAVGIVAGGAPLGGPHPAPRDGPRRGSPRSSS